MQPAPPLFDALTDHASEGEITAAAEALADDARSRAFCRETLAMLAENYQREAATLTGARATALRRAAHLILTEG